MITRLLMDAGPLARQSGSGAYVLPLWRDQVGSLGDLPAYLRTLPPEVEVIVVDGSPGAVFASHAALMPDGVTHIPVDPGLRTTMGKVGGVLTGIRQAACDRVVIADDDVRYTAANLRRMLVLLEGYDVVRPQNYFQPAPWHALWDSSRSLLNRAVGDGDWPGTLGVRRQFLLDAGGYRGDVMFENLELVRTVIAAGGRELVARDLFVARRPPSTRQFWSQRVRQAYDELARPWRMAFFLALLPLLLAATLAGGWPVPLAIALLGIATAEAGRRRDGAARHFSGAASLFAPAWLLERSVAAWLAIGSRVFLGGAAYRGSRLRDAATPLRQLRARLDPRRGIA